MPDMYCDHKKEHEKAILRAKEGILSLSDTQKIGEIFRVLADPTRLRIVLALLHGEMCVYHLAEVCDGTHSAISHQLRVLRDNKIVKAKRYGKNVEYSLADEHVYEIVTLAVKHLACDEEA